MTHRHRWAAALLCLSAGVAAAPAQASVFELFGAGPRTAAMAGVGAAAADGGAASFHNPALLVQSPLAGAWFGLATTQMQLAVTLQRPICVAGTATCTTAFPAGYSTRAPSLPANSNAMTMGWHYPLGGVLKNRMALGAALALPVGHLIRISGPDPQSPNFVQYEGMADRLAFLFSGAVRITDWWSAGIGVQVLAVLDATIDLRLDPTNHAYDRASIGIGLQPRARLVAGTAIYPTRELTFGVAYRQQMSLAYKIPTTVALGNPASLAIGLGHETLFSPDVVTVGTAWRTLDRRLLLAFDITVSRWSAMPDPSPVVTLDVGGPVVDGFGLGKALDVGTESPTIQMGMRDTLSPALAGEFRLRDAWMLRAGYRYRPTPAPRATGAYHYLDNDAHVASLGISWTFGTLAPRLQSQLAARNATEADTPGPLHIDLWTQAHWLPRRTVVPMDAQDPVGPMEHGGQVWGAGVALGGSF